MALQGAPQIHKNLNHTAVIPPPPPKRNPFQRFKPRELSGRSSRKLDSPPDTVYRTSHPGQLSDAIKDASEDSDDP